MTKNNRSGFSALPGGYRGNYGFFLIMGSHGGWWSATESDASHAYYRDLIFDSVYLLRSSYFKNCGFSVRLVKNE